MPINPLPDDTVRLLGSTADISTPVCLVKELLENALDSGASSIEILVSQDTVDRIEVRDNGNGIHPDDYGHLGRPGHTSKLTSLEELRNIGATTLGFRGQALASANTLGNVTVTTRTRHDPTAIRLTLRRGAGGVESQARTSAPVGTSVIVTALFSHIPVREQVITKKAKKHIVDIKQLLRAYALARPMIRLFFKVMGGAPKHSWSYSPPPEASVKEAVIQIFGIGVMSQCLLQTLAVETGVEDIIPQHGSMFAIEAVVPKPDADLSKLSKGSFFSIDSRPITTSYGTGRRLLNAFKIHFKKLRGVDDGVKALSDVFIRVNIQCSPGTYDPNIEPAKDDILFSNEPQVTELFERLCIEVYRTQDTRSAFVTIERRPLICRTQTRTPPPSSDGFEEANGPATLDTKDSAHGESIQPPQKPMWSHSSSLHPHPMRTDTNSTLYPQENERPRDSASPRHDTELPLSAAVAGLSSVQEIPRRTKARPTHFSTEGESARNINVDYSRMDLEDIRNEQVDPATNAMSPLGGRGGIPYQPAALNQSRKRGFVVDMTADPDMSSDEEAEILASRFRKLQETDSQQPHDSNENSMEGLDPWVIAKMTAPTRQPLSHTGIPIDISRIPSHLQDPATLSGVGYALGELPILRPLEEPPGDLDSPSIRRLGISPLGDRGAQSVHHSKTAASAGVFQINSHPADYDMPWPPSQPADLHDKRTLPNLRAHRSDWNKDLDPDGLIQTTLSFGGSRAAPKRSNNQRQMHIKDVPEKFNLPSRKPKRPSTQSKRSPVGEDVRISGSLGIKNIDTLHSDEHSGNIAREGPSVRSSQSPSLARFRSQENRLPHQSREPNPDTSDARDERIDTDPRDYLMRRQRSEAKHRGQARRTIKRVKTDMLPLELVLQGHEIQHLVLIVERGTETLGQIRKWDIQDEVINDQSWWDTIDLKEVAEIEEKTRQVFSVWAEKTLNEETEVEINLGRVVKGKGVAT